MPATQAEATPSMLLNMEKAASKLSTIPAAIAMVYRFDVLIFVCFFLSFSVCYKTSKRLIQAI
jgi:hypothetical protein